MLRVLHNRSAPSAATLKETLLAFLDGGFDAIKSGRLIVNSSGTGSSVSFEIPSILRGFSQDEVFGLAEQLVEIYEETTSSLSIAADVQDTGDQDSDIFAAMMADDRMQSITRVRDSFTLLNLNPSGPITQ